jgi:glutaminase
MAAKKQAVVQLVSEAADLREQALVERILPPGREGVTKAELTALIASTGLRLDDPRLARLLGVMAGEGPDLDVAALRRVVQPSVLLLEKALSGELIVPDFEGFSSDVRRIFEEAQQNRSGEIATYIPQLARVDPERFGLGLCTVDGQRLTLGDARERFSVQSSSKLVTYCMALEEHGEADVHRHVGREPSGRSFNELALDDSGLPHNPMVNAGAIMCAALVRPSEHIADRFDAVQRMWTRLTGGHRPGFSNSTYLSERSTADRNFALGYSMKESGAFPERTDLVQTLEFYFQLCSQEIDVDAYSVLAATLANGGVCPIDGEAVLEASTVRKCLSLMYSCGMYNSSGEWAFRVGLPAKSGVSGIVLVVVPNVLGLAIWSPRLDHHGNSVRGVEVCERLVSEFAFHNYDSLVGGTHGKKDPRRGATERARNAIVDLCWAAAEGDLEGLRRLVAEGADPGSADYDGRTPLHLAVAEGQEEVARYLLGLGVPADPTDRWGSTPRDEATRAGRQHLADIVEEARLSRAV